MLCVTITSLHTTFILFVSEAQEVTLQLEATILHCKARFSLHLHTSYVYITEQVALLRCKYACLRRHTQPVSWVPLTGGKSTYSVQLTDVDVGGRRETASHRVMIDSGR